MASKVFHKRLITITALILSAGLVISGCGTSGGNSKANTDVSKETGKTENKPTEIRMMTRYFSAQQPNPEEAFKIIQEHTNTMLNITWVPSPSYEEKVNTTLASGNLPEV